MSSGRYSVIVPLCSCYFRFGAMPPECVLSLFLRCVAPCLRNKRYLFPVIRSLIQEEWWNFLVPVKSLFLRYSSFGVSCPASDNWVRLVRLSSQNRSDACPVPCLPDRGRNWQRAEYLLSVLSDLSEFPVHRHYGWNFQPYSCFRYLSAETPMNRGTGGKLKAERGKRTLKCIE